MVDEVYIARHNGRTTNGCPYGEDSKSTFLFSKIIATRLKIVIRARARSEICHMAFDGMSALSAVTRRKITLKMAAAVRERVIKRSDSVP